MSGMVTERYNISTQECLQSGMRVLWNNARQVLIPGDIPLKTITKNMSDESQPQKPPTSLHEGEGTGDKRHALGSRSSGKGDIKEVRPLPLWVYLTVGGGGLIIILLIFIYGIVRLFAPTTPHSANKQVLTASTTLQNNQQVQETLTPVRIDTPVPTKAGSLPNSIIDSNGVSMAFIPAGPFQMGSNNGKNDEAPVHTVTLDAFYIDIYLVTNSRYKECVDAKVCKPPSRPDSYTRYPYYGDFEYLDFPVLDVSWNDALAYCQWRGARLPTEAEWEKAARGKLEGRTYPWGDVDPICMLGVQYGAQFVNCTPNDTVAVGSYAPNGYGLYDMAGNVWEWVADWYDENYYAASPEDNPPGPSTGFYRVLRGGSFGNDAYYLRVANRIKGSPDFNSYSVGFRCSR
jgi:formylglycine-generating enzyme required for sulfatase activity